MTPSVFIYHHDITRSNRKRKKEKKRKKERKSILFKLLHAWRFDCTRVKEKKRSI